jgi:uncharacterized protein
MPVQPTYPGVYIEEVSSGVRTITGVATAIAAFVGRSRRGPDNESVVINSYGDYERIFGGLWSESTMSFAVRDFFLNGGGQAVIVRLHNGAAAAEIRLPTGAAAPDDELHLTAANPGSWGNGLRVTIDYNTKPDPTGILFNLAISDEGGTVEKFINVTADKTKDRYLPKVLEQGSQLMRVKKDAGTGNYIIPAAPGSRPLVTASGVNPLSPPLSPPMAPAAAALPGSDGAALSDAQFFQSCGAVCLSANKKANHQ